jgi:hypothetical protein
MLRSDYRRVFIKLVVLVAMAGALFLSYSSTRLRAQTGPGCDNDYQYCTSLCSDQNPPGSDAYNTCVHGTSSSSCDSSYFTCANGDNPPIGQPQRPCPPCIQECDLMQQQCLADGVRTPAQCAYTTFRCKQRCNYYCIY